MSDDKATYTMLQLPETVGVAIAVWCGHYGVSPERERLLAEDGYNPEKIQDCVNDIGKLVEKYG